MFWKTILAVHDSWTASAISPASCFTDAADFLDIHGLAGHQATDFVEFFVLWDTGKNMTFKAP